MKWVLRVIVWPIAAWAWAFTAVMFIATVGDAIAAAAVWVREQWRKWRARETWRLATADADDTMVLFCDPLDEPPEGWAAGERPGVYWRRI